MPFVDLRSELDVILAQMIDSPQDKRELEFLVRQKLNELKATGMPLPQDLVDLDAMLDAQLTPHMRPPGAPA